MAFWTGILGTVYWTCMFTLLGVGAVYAGGQPACGNPTLEAQQAYDYLNQFREDPVREGEKLGLRLGSPATRPLRWSEQLAEIARKKAWSMAQHGYFAHQTPEGVGSNRQVVLGGYRLPAEYLADDGANTVESLAAGEDTGYQAISALLVDSGIPDAYHRVHLLGEISPFNEHTEVGIGVACLSESDYGSYYVILTAPKIEPAQPTTLSGKLRASGQVIR